MNLFEKIEVKQTKSVDPLGFGNYKPNCILLLLFIYWLQFVCSIGRKVGVERGSSLVTADG